MLTKEKVLQMIKEMPEESFDDIDLLLERLVIFDKIEKGLKDVEEGNVLSEEDFEKEIDSWFQ